MSCVHFHLLLHSTNVTDRRTDGCHARRISTTCIITVLHVALKTAAGKLFGSKLTTSLMCCVFVVRITGVRTLSHAGDVCVCVYVHVLKENQLELSTPKLVHM